MDAVSCAKLLYFVVHFSHYFCSYVAVLDCFLCGLAVTNSYVCLMSNFMHSVCIAGNVHFVTLYRLFAFVRRGLVCGVVHYYIGVCVISCTFIGSLAFVHVKHRIGVTRQPL